MERKISWWEGEVCSISEECFTQTISSSIDGANSLQIGRSGSMILFWEMIKRNNEMKSEILRFGCDWANWLKEHFVEIKSVSFQRKIQIGF